jgi:hypothetical protein
VTVSHTVLGKRNTASSRPVVLNLIKSKKVITSKKRGRREKKSEREK